MAKRKKNGRKADFFVGALPTANSRISTLMLASDRFCFAMSLSYFGIKEGRQSAVFAVFARPHLPIGGRPPRRVEPVGQSIRSRLDAEANLAGPKRIVKGRRSCLNVPHSSETSRYVDANWVSEICAIRRQFRQISGAS